MRTAIIIDRRCLVVLAATFALAPAVSRPTFAQAWPTRPARIVVPYAPRGSTDTVARITTDRLSRTWGQQVVIENKPGAGTDIGAAALPLFFRYLGDDLGRFVRRPRAASIWPLCRAVGYSTRRGQGLRRKSRKALGILGYAVLTCDSLSAQKPSFDNLMNVFSDPEWLDNPHGKTCSHCDGVPVGKERDGLNHQLMRGAGGCRDFTTSV